MRPIYYPPAETSRNMNIVWNQNLSTISDKLQYKI